VSRPPYLEAFTAVRLASQAPMPTEHRIAIMRAAGAVALLEPDADPRACALCHEVMRAAVREGIQSLLQTDANRMRLALLAELRALSNLVYRDQRAEKGARP
jgi:hypothetical protein